MNNTSAQQFNALQKATATFANDAKAADSLRRREGDLLNRAQEENRRLEEEMRAAHGDVGEETRRKENLDVERRRFEGAAEADREANVKITSELKGIEVRSRRRRRAYI